MTFKMYSIYWILLGYDHSLLDMDTLQLSIRIYKIQLFKKLRLTRLEK
jgi:hypothetical protein